MVLVLFVVVLASIVALVMGFAARSKAGRVVGTPLLSASQVGALRSATPVALEGAIDPLVWANGASGRKLLFAEMEVVAEWKEGDAQQSKVLGNRKTPGTFKLSDASGFVTVDTASGIEDVEEKIDTVSENECLQTLRSLDEGSFFGGGGGFVRRMEDVPRDATYKVKSRGFYAIPNGYVCGVWNPETQNVTGGNGRLLVSALGREALLASVAGRAQLCMRLGTVGLAASVVLGVVLFVVTKHG